MPSSMWFRVKKGIVIPTGLIVPFNDVAANISSGWEQFTSGDGKAIIGHTSSAGDTGGATGVSRMSSTEPGHRGTSLPMWISNIETGGPGDYVDTSELFGSHHHTATVSFTPAKRKQILMKATADHAHFPVNTGILSDVDKPLLSDITPTGYLLTGNSDASSSNSALSKSTSTSSEDGEHSHVSSGTGPSPVNSGSRAVNGYAGNSAHTHPGGTPTVTDSIKRFYLGMWQSAVAEIPVDTDMYGMWESATPPEGWVICDGTNGTTDLTDYFIGFDVTKLGTTEGAGTITTSSSLTSAGEHNHVASSSVGQFAAGYHANSGAHTHTIAGNADAFQPEYYTLIFIKATG